MKKSLAILSILLVPVLFLVISCGGSDNDSPAPINVAGTWEGYFAGINFPLGGEMAVTFVQDGSTLGGTIQYDIEGGISVETTTGTVTGSTVQFSVSDATNTTTYVGNVSGDTISGTVTTPSTPEDLVGNFVLTKTT